MSNGVSLIYAPCYSMLDATSGPNLDLLCVQQSGAAPICENYSMLYFDAKHLEKGLNRGRWSFWLPFFKEKKQNAHFGQFWKLPQFFRLDPVHHNIELYDLFYGISIRPKAFAILLNTVIDLIFSKCVVFYLIYSYRILIFMNIFIYFFEKGHFKGSSKKNVWRPPCSGEPDSFDSWWTLEV